MPLKKSTKVGSKKPKSLKQIAVENTQVTRGTKNKQEVIKSGTPNEYTQMHQSNSGVVGASLGVTKNMDNYESLRVDVWLTDSVKENETHEQAYERIIDILDKVLVDTVESYSEQ